MALVPPIVTQDEPDSGLLFGHCQIRQLTESFYANIQRRRLPNRLPGDLPRGNVRPEWDVL